MSTLHPDSAIIDRLGGTGRLAELCDVSSQAVSQWKRSGIPSARRAFLKLLNPGAFDLQAQVPAGDAAREPAVEGARNAA